MNRVLLHTTMMTPTERRVGRFLRAPDGHPEFGAPAPTPSGDSTPAPDNTGGNLADSGNLGADADNTGQSDVLKGFWEGKPEEAPADDSHTQESVALGGQLKTMIESFAPPAPVFTQENAEQIAAGNFESINQAMAASHQAAIKASIQASAQIIGAVVNRLTADFESRIESKLGQKDDSDFLKATFPQAKTPQFAPVVERVWQQSLINCKGNRDEATKQTRSMLEAMGSQFAPDSIRQPADDSTAGIDTAASKSLVAELLGR
jgi:hypothetical protein